MTMSSWNVGSAQRGQKMVGDLAGRNESDWKLRMGADHGSELIVSLESSRILATVGACGEDRLGLEWRVAELL